MFKRLKQFFRQPGESQSSTSAHFSDSILDSLFATTEPDEYFHGIKLNTDVTVASNGEKWGLAFLLLMILVVKPRVDILNRRPEMSMAFWICMAAICWKQLANVTWVPVLSTIIYTRTAYPFLVVLPHCIVAVASYRQERELQDKKSSSKDNTITNKLHFLPSFGSAFFCFGFGGSIVSDVLMGLPATALAHSRIVPCFMMGWVLVWYAPRDLIYKHYTNSDSFVRVMLIICEAIDAVTTPMGRVARGGRELQNKDTAPIVAGLLAGAGGAVLRYLERVVIRQQGSDVAQSSFLALEFAAWRTLGYALLWWYLAVYKCRFVDENDDFYTDNNCASLTGSDDLRVAIVVFHVVWTLACDRGFAGGHPFVWAVKQAQNIVTPIAKVFNLGPART